MRRVALLEEDPALLVGLREGRREALERIYRAYARPVERYLHALARASGADRVVGAGLIADLVQEVFTRAFSADTRLRYDGRRDFGQYVAGIARNCFIDALRARKREVPTDPGALPPDLEGAIREPEEGYDRRTLSVLAAYLAGLPAELALTYQQRFVLDRTQEEASAALGISRRTLRTRERQLRAGLRRALARANISLRELASNAAPSVSNAPLTAVFDRRQS